MCVSLAVEYHRLVSMSIESV